MPLMPPIVKGLEVPDTSGLAHPNNHLASLKLLHEAPAAPGQPLLYAASTPNASRGSTRYKSTDPSLKRLMARLPSNNSFYATDVHKTPNSLNRRGVTGRLADDDGIFKTTSSRNESVTAINADMHKFAQTFKHQSQKGNIPFDSRGKGSGKLEIDDYKQKQKKLIMSSQTPEKVYEKHAENRTRNRNFKRFVDLKHPRADA